MQVLSLKFIIGAIILLMSSGCGMASSHFMLMMIDEINKMRSENEQISYLGFTSCKTFSIFREYRRQYPQGRLHVAYLGTAILAVAFFLIVGGMIGFGPPTAGELQR